VQEVGGGKAPKIDDIRVVFGYFAKNETDPGNKEYRAEQVFEVDKIVKSSGPQDWAVLK
jgi:hypothetical protein